MRAREIFTHFASLCSTPTGCVPSCTWCWVWTLSNCLSTCELSPVTQYNQKWLHRFRYDKNVIVWWLNYTQHFVTHNLLNQFEFWRTEFARWNQQIQGKGNWKGLPIPISHARSLTHLRGLRWESTPKYHWVLPFFYCPTHPNPG